MKHSVAWKARIQPIRAGGARAPDARTQIHHVIGASVDSPTAIGGEQVFLVVARAEECFHRCRRCRHGRGIQAEAGRGKLSDKQGLLQIDGFPKALLLDEGQQLGVDGKPEGGGVGGSGRPQAGKP